VNLPNLGLQAFAPKVPARDRMYPVRARLGVPGNAEAQPAGVAESDLY
jgi:hypothetical protein